MKPVNLTFHYVFVRGAIEQIKQLCHMSNGFSFLIDRCSKERYAIISDKDMASFKNIARAYKNSLPYFPLEDIDLEEGDLVEVISGDFPGLIGTYMPKAKSNVGNIVLNVYNKVGTIAFNVKASDVRVLEFSKKCTRANDQIDAIIPQIYIALQLYNEEKELPPKLAAKLSVFCSRMGEVKINNRKLDAKLQTLLFAGNYILGNIEDAEKAKAKFEKLKGSVTNKWTLAFISLVFSVINNDKARLESAKSNIDNLIATSKAQIKLIEEFAHYTA